VLPFVLLLEGRDRVREVCWKAAAFLLGLAFSQEPLAGLGAAFVCATLVAGEASWTRPGFDHAAAKPRTCRPGAPWRVLGGWIVAGFVPQLLCFARLGADRGSLGRAYVHAWAWDGGSATIRPSAESIGSEIGWVTTVLALLGLALGLRIPRSRGPVLALAALVLVGAICAVLGAPTGPVRFGPAWLATIGAVNVLAGPCVQAILRLVASARGQAARSTAAMLLLVAAVLAVESSAETLERSRARNQGAVASWEDATWGSLPARALLLVDDDVVLDRAFAARAAGSIRGDVTVLAVGRFGPSPAVPGDGLRDSSLLPLIRDFRLLGRPGEGTLSTVAAERPLFMAYEPSWGRGLARHLLPVTLFDRYAPEPRTANDRRRSLDAFSERSERALRAAADDPQLAEVTRRLLRARDELSKEAGGR
jgi:hypothetical protein